MVQIVYQNITKLKVHGPCSPLVVEHYVRYRHRVNQWRSSNSHPPPPLLKVFHDAQNSLFTLFLLPPLTISSHWHRVMFCFSQPSAALQTLSIFDDPISSWLRLWTCLRTAFDRWTVECDRCIIDLDGAAGSGWLCFAINLTSTNSVISFITISILVGHSHEVCRKNSTSCLSRLLSNFFMTCFLTGKLPLHYLLACNGLSSFASADS